MKNLAKQEIKALNKNEMKKIKGGLEISANLPIVGEVNVKSHGGPSFWGWHRLTDITVKV